MTKKPSEAEVVRTLLKYYGCYDKIFEHAENSMEKWIETNAEYKFMDHISAAYYPGKLVTPDKKHLSGIFGRLQYEHPCKCSKIITDNAPEFVDQLLSSDRGLISAKNDLINRAFRRAYDHHFMRLILIENCLTNYFLEDKTSFMKRFAELKAAHNPYEHLRQIEPQVQETNIIKFVKKELRE